MVTKAHLMGPVAVLLVAALAASLAPTAARAGAGDLLWEDRVALFSAGFPTTTVSAITVANGKVIAAGWGPWDGNPRNNADVLVRAYDPRTGDLLWADRWDESGFADEATGIAAAGDVVLVAGRGKLVGRLAGESIHFIVRAYDVRTGEPLWQDSLNRGCAFGASAIVTHANRAFVGGSCLRAYDTRTGAVAWEAEATGALALAAEGGRLFALASDASGPFLRAYDAETGTASWEVPLAGAQTVGAGGGVVFLTSQDPSPSLSRHLLAFDAATGTPLWQADLGTVSGASGLPSDLQKTAITFEGGRIFVAGPDNDYLARAYEARSGELVWTADQPGGAHGVAIAAGGGEVFLAGSRDGRFLTRTYSALDGQLVWEDEVTAPAGGVALAAAWGGGRVFVGGSNRLPSAPYPQYLLRAYGAK
jgi:outer membrane protein assembly factor BamB